MVNIPTDLLRTLISVIDFRSHTKAAHFLGMTQPAVSTQIKRLQELLGAEIFDKSAPGIRLTTKGEIVAAHARRILAMNDKLVHLTSPTPPVNVLRVGVPCEFGRQTLASVFMEVRARSPELRFHIRSDASENLLTEMEGGGLDLAVALTTETPAFNVRHYWPEDLIWARSEATKVSEYEPVRFVTYSDNCIFGQLAITALSRAGRDHELTVTSPNVLFLSTAVHAGFGVMPVARCAVPQDLTVWEDAPLPKLPKVLCGIYLRNGVDHGIPRIADALAEAMRSS